MAVWQNKILLNPEWMKCQSREITTAQLCESIANKLRNLKPYDDPIVQTGLNNLVKKFDKLAEGNPSFNKVDNLMEKLYDWGDVLLEQGETFSNSKRVCWIDTLTEVNENESKV